MSELGQDWRQFLQEHGYYAVSFTLQQAAETPSLEELHQWMRWDEPRYTGWPPFWWPTRKEIEPQRVDAETYECIHDGTGRVGHIERWRASTNGVFTIIRAYDSDYEEPGEYLELTMPAWRTAELLLYAGRMAARFASPSVDFTLRYTGLAGRGLRAKFAPNRILTEGYTTRAPQYEKRVAVTAGDIDTGVAEMTDDLIRDLYSLFGLALPANLCEVEVKKMRSNRF